MYTYIIYHISCVIYSPTHTNNTTTYFVFALKHFCRFGASHNEITNSGPHDRTGSMGFPKTSLSGEPHPEIAWEDVGGIEAAEVAKELHDLTYLSAWVDFLDGVPHDMAKSVIDCILQTTVQSHADFTRRVIKGTARSPVVSSSVRTGSAQHIMRAETVARRTLDSYL